VPAEIVMDAKLCNGAICVPSLCSYLLLFFTRPLFEFCFTPR